MIVIQYGGHRINKIVYDYSIIIVGKVWALASFDFVLPYRPVD